MNPYLKIFVATSRFYTFWIGFGVTFLMVMVLYARLMDLPDVSMTRALISSFMAAMPVTYVLAYAIDHDERPTFAEIMDAIKQARSTD